MNPELAIKIIFLARWWFCWCLSSLIIFDFNLFISELQQITEKIDLPLYDFVTGNDGIQDDFGNQKQLKTEQLLMEFDSIYDAVELDHLTPPQTPPECEQNMLLGVVESQFHQNIPSIEQPQQFIFDYQQEPASSHDQYIFLQNDASEQEISIMFESSGDNSNEIIIDPEPIITSPADIQRELEVVEEIIQAHSRSQSEFDDDNCTSFTSSSWSPRSDYSASICSLDDDEPSKKKSSGLHGVTKKRTRAYGRNPDEKRSRKKEQNKNAATRYRQKKKEEVGVIMGEERILMDKNKRLSTSHKDLVRETKYLKSLLRELFQARGFIQ